MRAASLSVFSYPTAYTIPGQKTIPNFSESVKMAELGEIWRRGLQNGAFRTIVPTETIRTVSENLCEERELKWPEQQGSAY